MDTKKKFILFSGVGWCGTTSLYYTLMDKIKYMHGGWAKESRTLSRIFFELNKPRMEGAYSLLINSLNYIGNNNSQDLFKAKFTEKELNSYFGPNVSLKKYVNHYVRLAEYCGEYYQAVGDFSNTNFDLTPDMLNQIKSELSLYFDVKVIIIFRDFIRRQWSETCMFTHGKYFAPKYNITSKVVDNFEPIHCLSYVSKLKELYNIFGKENVHYIIMEDFFKDQKNNPEVFKLEKFLNIKISEVYPCVFVPDKGINPPKIDGLKDQWISDHKILTEEFYTKMRCRKDYAQSYNEFKELHGFLPADWGRPIDYGY